MSYRLVSNKTDHSNDILINYTDDILEYFLPSYLIKANKIYRQLDKINSISWSKNSSHIFSSSLNHPHYLNQKGTTKLLVMKGIPNHLRSEVWFTLSGAKHEQANNTKNYYKFLVESYPISLPYDKQIDLDLKRTFPKESFFSLTTTQSRLRNILRAYSRRNPDIGYVQGFNFIVGRLLSVLSDEPDEKIFWIFVQIIEYLLPTNYYSEMCGLMADVDIMLRLIQVCYPAIYNHLEECEVLDYFHNILLQLFLSIFTHNFPYNAQVFIFDMFFVEGSIILFKAASAIIKYNEDKLLKVTNVYELKQSLDENNICFDSLKFKMFLMDSDFPINSQLLTRNRSNVSRYIKNKVDDMNKFKKDRIKEESTKLRLSSEIHCETNWPICQYDYSSTYNIFDFLILQQSQPMVVIEDYFKFNSSNEFNFQSQKNFSDDDLEPMTTRTILNPLFDLELSNKKIDLEICGEETTGNNSYLFPLTHKSTSSKFSFNKMGYNIIVEREESSLNNILIVRRIHTTDCSDIFQNLNSYRNSNDTCNKEKQAENSIGYSSEIDNKKSLNFECETPRFSNPDNKPFKKPFKNPKILSSIGFMTKNQLKEENLSPITTILGLGSRGLPERNNSYFPDNNTGKGKSLSLINSPFMIKDSLNDEDFCSFVDKIKLRYNKVIETRRFCLNLLESNRKKMIGVDYKDSFNSTEEVEIYLG